MPTQADSKTGIVFNIQRYSLHDGPGIRTVVFLKGCPLRCQWCSNPESQQRLPELAFKPSKCIGCQRCQPACSLGAITHTASGLATIDRSRCQSCFQCTRQCPAKALDRFGQNMRVQEVIKAAQADSAFYIRSGGGLTLSGGEPLMQADFVVEILQEARKQRLDATIETCGYAAWNDVQKVAAELKSTIIYDVKSIDPVKHRHFTGVTNEIILDNLQKLRQTFPHLNILVRTPVIPGFNDSQAEITAIIDYLKDWPNLSYELLPYHRLGQQKYDYLGRDYHLGEVSLEPSLLQQLQGYVKKAGLLPSKK
jgi:pyruvate formate lyase activating enzyme